MENAGGGPGSCRTAGQEGTVVSSTVIRQAIQSGDMTGQVSYLGEHEWLGEIVRGDGEEKASVLRLRT